MNINKIGVYSSISFRGSVPINAVKTGEKTLVEAAKKELEVIKEQGQSAGTDAAWWRSEFREAKEALEKLVKDEQVDKQTPNQYSGLMSFHDSDDDGLI